MHNKTFVADGAVGIVGGRNIGDEYFDPHADGEFPRPRHPRGRADRPGHLRQLRRLLEQRRWRGRSARWRASGWRRRRPPRRWRRPASAPRTVSALREAPPLGARAGLALMREQRAAPGVGGGRAGLRPAGAGGRGGRHAQGDRAGARRRDRRGAARGPDRVGLLHPRRPAAGGREVPDRARRHGARADQLAGHERPEHQPRRLRPQARGHAGERPGPVRTAAGRAVLPAAGGRRAALRRRRDLRAARQVHRDRPRGAVRRARSTSTCARPTSTPRPR